MNTVLAAVQRERGQICGRAWNGEHDLALREMERTDWERLGTMVYEKDILEVSGPSDRGSVGWPLESQ